MNDTKLKTGKFQKARLLHRNTKGLHLMMGNFESFI